MRTYHSLDFFKENQFFFIGFFLFLALSFGVLCWIEKGDAILYFSEHRSDFNTVFFSIGTKLGEHYTYLIAILSCLFISYRYALLFPIIAILVTLLSAGLKWFFAHPRPMKYFEMVGGAENINLISGEKVYMAFSSFPSGHTMSGFAVFALLAFITKHQYLKLLFLMTAIIVGISRIYLVHHFLEDICFGAFLGVLLAIGLFQIQAKFPSDNQLWYNKKWKV